MPVKKVKSEPKDADEIKKEKNMEKKIEKQDKLYHKYRDALKEYRKNDIHSLMEANAQETCPFDEVRKLIESSTCFGILCEPVCGKNFKIHHFIFLERRSRSRYDGVWSTGALPRMQGAAGIRYFQLQVHR